MYNRQCSYWAFSEISKGKAWVGVQPGFPQDSPAP